MSTTNHDSSTSLGVQGVDFASFALNPGIHKALVDSGYTAPSQVQAQAIPEVLNGRDLMVSAPTGSGKTAAFMLPVLHKLCEPSAGKGKGPRVLVLSPTRELTQQISKAAETYGKYLPRLRIVSVVGGLPYGAQIRVLKQPVEVLVATPGRLIDHMESGRIDFSRLEVIILDEADRMLDMGFIEDIERIMAQLPEKRQTLLFSATLDGAIGRLAQKFLSDPLRIEVESRKDKHVNIEQRLHFTDDVRHKNRLLDHLLRDVELKQAIVFTATKRDADQLAQDLNIRGYAAAALHGDMNQRQRQRTLQAVHKGGVRVLVATDVAARGIDVSTISHVINYDLPKQPEDYVHRIGRTGRGGKSGIAITFANGNERGQLKRIERYTTYSIPVHTVVGLEPTAASHSAKPDARAKRPGSGVRRPTEGARKWGAPSSTPGKTYGKPTRAPSRMRDAKQA